MAAPAQLPLLIEDSVAVGKPEHLSTVAIFSACKQFQNFQKLNLIFKEREKFLSFFTFLSHYIYIFFLNLYLYLLYRFHNWFHDWFHKWFHDWFHKWFQIFQSTCQSNIHANHFILYPHQSKKQFVGFLRILRQKFVILRRKQQNY